MRSLGSIGLYAVIPHHFVFQRLVELEHELSNSYCDTLNDNLILMKSTTIKITSLHYTRSTCHKIIEIREWGKMFRFRFLFVFRCSYEARPSSNSK